MLFNNQCTLVSPGYFDKTSARRESLLIFTAWVPVGEGSAHAAAASSSVTLSEGSIRP
jgi:hypothetical protein